MVEVGGKLVDTFAANLAHLISGDDSGRRRRRGRRGKRCRHERAGRRRRR